MSKTAHKSAYPHFWLYAKNWYERIDLLKDSKTLVGYYAALDPELVSIDDCFSLWFSVLQEANNYCPDVRASYPRVLENIWKNFNFDYRRSLGIEDPRLTILQEIYAAIQCCVIFSNEELHKPESKRVPYIDLGKPDSNILPLKAYKK